MTEAYSVSGDRTPSSDTCPSPLIDAAICDLISLISNFSDDDFDAEWMSLTEEEVIQIVALSIQYLGQKLNGKFLSGLLLQVREGEAVEAEDLELTDEAARTDFIIQ